MNVLLSFVRPTENNDGSPLNPADIARFTVSGIVTPPGGPSVPASVFPFALEPLDLSANVAIANAVAGDTVCLTLKTVLMDAAQSDASSAGCVVLSNRPNPPTNLTLTNA